MDFSFNEEQTMLFDMVKDFSLEKIAPRASEIDNKGEFPADLLDEISSQGLMGVTIASDLDGAGMDTLSLCIALEEIAKGCASAAAMMSAHNALAAYAISTFGSEEQKKKYLPALASGKTMGAYGYSESEGSYGATGISTVAGKDGSHFILNGSKSFVVNGTSAGIFVVFARVDDGLSCFIVEKDSPGLVIGAADDITGLTAAGMCGISFKDCRVPESNLLGGEGDAIASRVEAMGHLALAAVAAGIAEAATSTALRYSQERKQFGQFISNFYMIQAMLSQMATDTDASRLMVYKAAWLADQNLPFTKEASMAKLFSCDAAVRTTINAIQVHGGYGYTKEYTPERYLRDAKIVQLLLGTADGQKALIAQQLLNK